MLDRRKMFTAMMAVGGLSAVAADHAVALAFSDGDYLRERAERLRLHEAEVDRLDAENRAYRAKNEAEQKICDGYLSQCRRAGAFGTTITLTVPYWHYDILSRNNLIDFVVDEEAKGPTFPHVPTMLGQRIKVTAE